MGASIAEKSDIRHAPVELVPDARAPSSDDMSRFAIAEPNAELAHSLSAMTTELVKGWLAEYLANCEQALGLDLSDDRRHIVALPADKLLHPYWHALAHHLEAGIEAQNAELVLDWLASLRRWTATPRERKTPYIAGILAEGWESANVARMRTYDQLNIRGEPTKIWPIFDDSELKRHRTNIEKALDLIRQYDPELAGEFDAFVCCIRLFSGQVLRGETSPATFGAIWLRVPEPEQDQVAYWLEHLTHEVSHLRLEALFMQEVLVLNPYGDRHFRAPIRDDPRPLRGVFHATFVVARMIRLFRRLSIAGMDKRLRDMLRLFELQFEIGMATLRRDDACFSTDGAAIRDLLPACCLS